MQDVMEGVAPAQQALGEAARTAQAELDKVAR